MNILLCAVVASVVILLAVISIQSIAGIKSNGLSYAAGARDAAKDISTLKGRADRTVANHIEGMMLFVPLALVAHAMGLSGDMIVKGSWMYIIGRAIYPLTYWTGLPWVRTLIWGVSLIGTIMILIAILQAK